MAPKHKEGASAPAQDAQPEATPQEGGRYQRLTDGTLARLPDEPAEPTPITE